MNESNLSDQYMEPLMMIHKLLANRLFSLSLWLTGLLSYASQHWRRVCLVIFLNFEDFFSTVAAAAAAAADVMLSMRESRWNSHETHLVDGRKKSHILLIDHIVVLPSQFFLISGTRIARLKTSAREMVMINELLTAFSFAHFISSSFSFTYVQFVTLTRSEGIFAEKKHNKNMIITIFMLN